MRRLTGSRPECPAIAELAKFGSRIDQSRERSSAYRDTTLMDRDRVSREIQRIDSQLMIENDPQRIRDLAPGAVHGDDDIGLADQGFHGFPFQDGPA